MIKPLSMWMPGQHAFAFCRQHATRKNVERFREVVPPADCAGHAPDRAGVTGRQEPAGLHHLQRRSGDGSPAEIELVVGREPLPALQILHRHGAVRIFGHEPPGSLDNLAPVAMGARHAINRNFRTARPALLLASSSLPSQMGVALGDTQVP